MTFFNSRNWRVGLAILDLAFCFVAVEMSEFVTIQRSSSGDVIYGTNELDCKNLSALALNKTACRCDKYGTFYTGQDARYQCFIDGGQSAGCKLGFSFFSSRVQSIDVESPYQQEFQYWLTKNGEKVLGRDYDQLSITNLLTWQFSSWIHRDTGNDFTIDLDEKVDGFFLRWSNPYWPKNVTLYRGQVLLFYVTLHRADGAIESSCLMGKVVGDVKYDAKNFYPTVLPATAAVSTLRSTTGTFAETKLSTALFTSTRTPGRRGSSSSGSNGAKIGGIVIALIVAVLVVVIIVVCLRRRNRLSKSEKSKVPLSPHARTPDTDYTIPDRDFDNQSYLTKLPLEDPLDSDHHGRPSYSYPYVSAEAYEGINKFDQPTRHTKQPADFKYEVMEARPSVDYAVLEPNYEKLKTLKEHEDEYQALTP